MVVIFSLNQEACLIKIFNDLLSCLIAVHACIFGIIVNDLGIVGHNVDNSKIMTFSNLKVVRVVSGSDLYNARTKFNINIIVGNNRNFSADQRKYQGLADNILISVIVRVNSDSGISQQSFGTGSCKLNITRAVLERIAKMPEMSRLILIGDLGV